jgi:hypothetical protein
MFTDDELKDINENMQREGDLSDFSNCVNHEIILDVLYFYAIQAAAANLLRSYHIAKNGNWRLNRSIKK